MCFPPFGLRKRKEGLTPLCLSVSLSLVMSNSSPFRLDPIALVFTCTSARFDRKCWSTCIRQPFKLDAARARNSMSHAFQWQTYTTSNVRSFTGFLFLKKKRKTRLDLLSFVICRDVSSLSRGRRFTAFNGKRRTRYLNATNLGRDWQTCNVDMYFPFFVFYLNNIPSIDSICLDNWEFNCRLCLMWHSGTVEWIENRN